MNKVTIPVSVGELLDKISILEIKQEKIKDTNKLVNIEKELDYLRKKTLSLDLGGRNHRVKIEECFFQLKKVNRLLWDIENKKRLKEKEKSFDQEFIELSRAVYINNDNRASIKKKINNLTDSEIVEEKSY